MPANVEQTERLITAIERLAAAIEIIAPGGLGDMRESRYPVCPPNDGLASEEAMAQMLDIPARTLAKHRRAGKFSGCWIRNGKRMLWRVAETLETWSRGIA
jgi:hypothetical protein